MIGASLCALLLALGPDGDTHERVAALDRELARAPDRADLYVARADLHRLHGHWAAAEADLAMAEGLGLDTAGLHKVRARVECGLGRHGAAEASFGRALAFGDDPELRLERARSRAALERWEGAIADFDAAISGSRYPRPGPYVERAQALAARGQDFVDRALAGLEAGRQRLGPLIVLEVCALDIETASRRFAAALVRVQRLEDEAQRKERWQSRRGDLLAEMARPEAAGRAYRAALESIGALPRRLQATRAVRRLQIELEHKLAALETGRP